MDIGLVGLGKMGGNMRTRLRNAGHTVVGYDRNPDVARRRQPRGAWSTQLPVPEGGLGDGARRRPDPRDHRASSASCSARATWSSTAATPSGPTTRLNAEMLAEKGIGFVDCGVSGGVWGLENGYALMCGGADEDVAKVQPAFDALKPEGEFGFVHAGKSPAPATSPRWSTTASSTP